MVHRKFILTDAQQVIKSVRMILQDEGVFLRCIFGQFPTEMYRLLRLIEISDFGKN